VDKARKQYFLTMFPAGGQTSKCFQCFLKMENQLEHCFLAMFPEDGKPEHLTIIGEYSPIITESEANNCFSIFVFFGTEFILISLISLSV
jgi:hypothetical protein